MSNIVLPSGKGIIATDSNTGEGLPVDARQSVQYYKDIANLAAPYIDCQVIVREDDSTDLQHPKGIYVITKLTELGNVDTSGIKTLKEYLGIVNIFNDNVDVTDAERNKALANISNQIANNSTGKMGYVVLQPEKSGDATTSFATQIANKPNTIFEIRDVFELGNTSETPISIPNGCILKFVGGMLKNGALEGTSTSVVSDVKDKPIFDGVTFSGKWCNSSLTAINFGYVNDMTYEDYLWEYKTLSIQTKKAQGTDNADAREGLKSFLTGAENISIEFNGSFYFGDTTNLLIYSANNIELFGGNLLTGITFYGCKNCQVHDIYFSGYHKPHAFPKLCYNPGQISDDVFNVNEGFDNIGVVNAVCVSAGASFMNPTYFCENIICNNCTFEMHVNGFTVSKPTNAYNRYCYCRDCSFDSVFYQPIGFHGEHCGAENITGRYCGQAVDFSSWCHDCYAKNVFALEGFGSGPKIDAETQASDYTYNCTLEDCYFEMKNGLYVDTSIRGLSVNGSKQKSDTLKVIRCKFDVSTSNNFNTIGSSSIQFIALYVNSGCRIIDSEFNIVGKVTYAISNYNSLICENTNYNISRVNNTFSYIVFSADNSEIEAVNCGFNYDAYDAANYGLNAIAINGSVCKFNKCNFSNVSTLVVLSQNVYFNSCSINALKVATSNFFAQGTSKKIILSVEGCDIVTTDNLIDCFAAEVYADIIFKNNKISTKQVDILSTTNTTNIKFVFENNICTMSGTFAFVLPQTNLSEESFVCDNIFLAPSGQHYIVDYTNAGKLTCYTEMADNNIYGSNVANPQCELVRYRAASLSSKKIGYMFFNKTTGIPNYWYGTNWVDAAGNVLS